MDIKMRLMRLPVEKSKPLIQEIKSSCGFDIPSRVTVDIPNNIQSKEQTEENEFEVDLDAKYILNKDEYHRLTEEWSKGKVMELPEVAIHQIFENQVNKTPAKTALVFNDKSLTYEQLNQKANQLAYFLQQNGVGPGDFVALYLEKSLEMVVVILSVLKCGAAYIPLDPGYPKERIKKILFDSSPKVVITSQTLSDNVSHIESLLIIEELDNVGENYPILNPTHDQSIHERLAYIIYTSGSTGTPKGVQIGHQSLVNFILSISHLYEINSSDRVLQFASVAFDVSVFDIFVSLCTGATLIIANESERKSPEDLTALMNQQGITVAELPPALVQVLNPDKFPHLRLISVGGEKFSGELVSRWATSKRRFMNGYGPTETTVAVTVYECKGQWIKNPPIGLPIHNVNAYVLNNRLEPMPIGIPGELYIGGLNLSIGYLNNDQLTSKNFVTNPFDTGSKSKIYRTGDLVRWLPDGNLEILGRIDRQVKVRGHRIELEEIESILMSEQRIEQTVVEPCVDENGNNQLVAYVVLGSQQELNTVELRQRLQEKLPSYMVPSRFMYLEALPLTSNGKLDRKALPKPNDLRPDGIQYVEPKDGTELKICNEIFSPLLGIKKIGITDNFFDLGGDSIQATRVVSSIRSIFNIDLNLIDFFQSPTVETISEIVRKKEKLTESRRGDLLLELNELEGSWLKINSEPGAKFRLVCFPYAGSNGYVFNNWPKKLAPDFEIITIESPGHGTKIKQTPFDVAYDVANRLASEICLLADKPLIFLGHSGGAILAFETSRILLERGVSIHRLFAIASRAPHVDLKEPPRYHLPTEQFIKRVNEFGGLSQEFLNNKALLDVMIPVMRADEKLAENYKYTGDLRHIKFPISVYGGKDDRITVEDLKEWFEINPASFDIKMFPGGHFFLQDNEDEVLLSIIESIAKVFS